MEIVYLDQMSNWRCLLEIIYIILVGKYVSQAALSHQQHGLHATAAAATMRPEINAKIKRLRIAYLQRETNKFN